jgi:CBS domain-containing protein
MLAKDIMTPDVVKVTKDTPAKQIAKLLIEKRISGVPVVDENDCILGVVTERDLLFKMKEPVSVSWVYQFGDYLDPDQLGEEWRKIRGSKAEDIMSKGIVCLPENTPGAKIAALMIREGVKRVFIVRGKQLVGVVSKADILKDIVARMGRTGNVG